MKLAQVLQPRHFGAFRCIGSDCEDTCCIGWQVHVDKPMYEKYQDCSDPQCGSSLRTLVKINENSSTDDDYAKIGNGGICPFLSDRLCSIQQRLGEEYLPTVCAIYPRIMNRVDEVLQRSLDVACPEAARLVLLDPRPMEFDEQEYIDGSLRLGNVPPLDVSSLKDAPEPYRFFRGVRRLVISLLQDRSYPIWKRLFMLGRLCEKLDELISQGGDQDTPNIIRKYIGSLDNGIFGDLVANGSADPTAQLEVVLELIVAQISSDFNPRSFLACYKEFMDGIEWTRESAMHEIGSRYAEAYARHYVPVISQHEHILENYLVNYAHRTLFPFGLPESNRRLHNDRVPSHITAQYMLMIACYATIQTLLIGMAGFHKEGFGPHQIVRLIQSFSKTFEHSVTYPGRAIGMLADKAMIGPASLCVLTRN